MCTCTHFYLIATMIAKTKQSRIIHDSHAVNHRDKAIFEIETQKSHWQVYDRTRLSHSF